MTGAREVVLAAPIVQIIDAGDVHEKIKLGMIGAGRQQSLF